MISPAAAARIKVDAFNAARPLSPICITIRVKESFTLLIPIAMHRSLARVCLLMMRKSALIQCPNSGSSSRKTSGTCSDLVIGFVWPDRTENRRGKRPPSHARPVA